MTKLYSPVRIKRQEDVLGQQDARQGTDVVPRQHEVPSSINDLIPCTHRYCRHTLVPLLPHFGQI